MGASSKAASNQAASRIRKRDVFKRLYARHVHSVIEWIEPLAFIAAWVLSAVGLLYYRAYTSPWAWLVAIVVSLPVSEVTTSTCSVHARTPNAQSMYVRTPYQAHSIHMRTLFVSEVALASAHTHTQIPCTHRLTMFLCQVIMTMVSVAIATGWIRFTGSGQQSDLLVTMEMVGAHKAAKLLANEQDATTTRRHRRCSDMMGQWRPPQVNTLSAL